MPSCSAAPRCSSPRRAHEGSDRGYSWLFQQHVTQADEGCDFDFLQFRGAQDHSLHLCLPRDFRILRFRKGLQPPAREEAMPDGASALQLVLGGDPALYSIVALSLYVSLSAVALAAIVALPFGALLALTQFPGPHLRSSS